MSIAMPASMPAANLLDVRDLTVEFPTHAGVILPVNETSFALRKGTTLGLVGESGSGKSVTLRAILGLIPPPGAIRNGSVLLDGEDLVTASPARLRSLRGKVISMIFQDPMASLNPVLSVGDQISETLRVKSGLGRRAALERGIALFERVGIKQARQRMGDYPHQFSGGMAQRVMIAIAIAGDPQLLLADEPTTALDVSIQDQVLDLLDDLRTEMGMAMVIVSHDIGVIARSCDHVAVMYAGRIFERGPVADVLRYPRHPYTRMLIGSVPGLVPNVDKRPLATISGQLPSLATVRTGCPFVTRCPHVRPACPSMDMRLDAPDDGHGSACPFV